jgi:hypothetical protein
MQRPHDELLTSFQAMNQHVQLVCQLFALCTALIRLASDIRHHISRETRHFERRENVTQLSEETRFDSFDCDVVDKALASNLIRKVNVVATA